MTQEEIEKQSEEYADEILKLKPKNILSRRDMLVMDFQAGAKWGIANAIEWHDLRKDPNDLPKEGVTVLLAFKSAIDGSTCTESYVYTQDNFVNQYTYDTIPYFKKDGVLYAWCELPQFKG